MTGGIALYSLCAADGVRHYSPHVWKAILAFRHKGLEFELRPVTFADIPGIAGGGFDSVPVLDDHDSFGIALHLEAAHPGPSLFPGPGQQALARLVEHHCNTVLNPPLSVIVVRQMHDMMGPADQAHFRAARQRRFGASVEELAARSAAEAAGFPGKLALMRRILAEQGWLAGEAPGFADHILFGTLQWHRIFTGAALVPPDDPVEQWFRRCAARYGCARRLTGLAARAWRRAAHLGHDLLISTERCAALGVASSVCCGGETAAIDGELIADGFVAVESADVLTNDPAVLPDYTHSA